MQRCDVTMQKLNLESPQAASVRRTAAASARRLALVRRMRVISDAHPRLVRNFPTSPLAHNTTQ